MGTNWRDHLTALLAEPYAGHGGKVALAKALGRSPVTVGNWLAGRTAPGFDDRQKLAELHREKAQK